MIVLFELAAVIFIIWGYCHEGKFIAFENRIFGGLSHDKTKDD